MPSERAFTSREKNDIFRAKRRRYEVSAGLRGGIGRELFNRDTEADEAAAKLKAPDEEKQAVIQELIKHYIPDPSEDDPEFEAMIASGGSAVQVYEPELESFRSVLKNVSDTNLFRLLSRRAAAISQTRFLLQKTPVDRIMAKHISSISPIRPSYIDESIKLCDIPGYVEMVEEEEITLSDTESMDTIRTMVGEVKEYLYAHPYQFEAQYLISVVTGTEGLTDMLVKAWALYRWADSVSLSEEFGKRPAEEIKQVYDVFVLTDLVCRIGYTITELVTECRDMTIGEATDVFAKELPQISLSRLLDQSGDTFKRILTERGHLDVL